MEYNPVESDYKRSEVTKILQDAGIDELIKHLSDAMIDFGAEFSGRWVAEI